MKPFVSILIPAFNSEKWIADTLSSALAQTWDAKEIIVVDDGSSDRTPNIAKRFEPRGVRIISQLNQGAAAARNEAFRQCRGDYIQWLDSDDLLAPDKIASQMNELRGPRMLLSGAWGYFLYRHNRARFIPSPLWFDLSRCEWLTRKMSQNLHMQTATWLVSRELTEAAGPWDTTLLGDDDGEYFCRVLLASEGVHFVPVSKVYYRSSGTNSLSYIGRSQKKMSAHWRSMRLHMEYLLSMEDSERTRAACVTYMQNWFASFYPERQEIVSEAQSFATALGGVLVPPTLSWKYSWIRSLFGWRTAKRAQLRARSVRWSLQRRWEKALFAVETRATAPFLPKS